ncbi:MAG: hypothetical protein E7337_15425 [Clostridiales bacterium]|nr:hypothetical protein [Clostridiales bacterium]
MAFPHSPYTSYCIIILLPKPRNQLAEVSQYLYTNYTDYTDYTPYTRYTINPGKSREIESQGY